MPKKTKRKLPEAERGARSEASEPGRACVVCGEPAAPISPEQLCWICRRLKISAWRDQDLQMTAEG
jgi:hypothetical protein